MKKGHKSFLWTELALSWLIVRLPTLSLALLFLQSCPKILTSNFISLAIYFVSLHIIFPYQPLLIYMTFFKSVAACFKKENVNALAIRPSEMKGLGLTSIGILWKSNQMHCNNQSTTLFISLIKTCSFNQ